eukprot:CAMPEP_0170591850 /NCGR_PEP_ID=MMETSP0224-20130122/12622_1 /TAXON_ID=285029 /ORGANISM="Togula jolla, Strain CCCM 725" /LENGTH=102 /DNA_ID=CAMNT_0010915739 /DNA_START=1017 /DNA_END=1325 /DNA_ORIENTATION=-
MTDVVQPELRLLESSRSRSNELPNAELEPSELHDVALHEAVAACCEVTHYEPELLRAAGRCCFVNPERSILLYQADERISPSGQGQMLAHHLHFGASANTPH